MASYALSNVKIQIYGDKYSFQNVHFAGSEEFWGNFNCLKPQKILASARFPHKNKN